MGDSKRIPVTLAGDQHARLIAAARKLDTSAAELIREAVESALPVFEKEARQAEHRGQEGLVEGLPLRRRRKRIHS